MTAIESIATTPTPGSEPAVGRQRILDEAAALFVQQGFAATSVRHIAAACGMRASSIYYHFASKNELLEAVFARGMDVMVDAFEDAATTGAGADAQARVGAHVRAHLSALFENGPYTAAHVTTFHTAPSDVHNAVVPRRDAYEAMWTNLLTELARRGEIAGDTPIGLSRLTLFGAMNTTIEWFDTERGNLDELADVITNQFLNGVRP
jgi:AcrR family transcriptional regulator